MLDFFGGLMSIFEAIICGITQGACEFLPVSSSGHLALIHGMLGYTAGEDDALFDVLLHLGTLFSVAIFYWKDIFQMIRAVPSLLIKAVCGKLGAGSLNEGERVLTSLFFASLPMLAAVFFKDEVELLSDYPRVVGALLVINGFVLIFGELIKRKDGSCRSLGALSSLGIGLFQLTAVVPGLSRSGMTMTGGRVFGLSREESVRFSFLMSIPAIIGANVFSISDAAVKGVEMELPVLAAGVVSAAIAGALSIWVIKRISRCKKLYFFGIYCIAVGIVAMAF